MQIPYDQLSDDELKALAKQLGKMLTDTQLRLRALRCVQRARRVIIKEVNRPGFDY